MKKHHTGALAVLFMLMVTSARGQESETAIEEVGFDRVEQELYLAVARVCANEAFGHPADCMLIWQAVRHHGSSAEERLDWLTRHSSCVLGPDEPVPSRRRPRFGNCPWTRHLDDSDAEPIGWPSRWRWASPEGSRAGHSATWERTRTLVRGLVEGRRPAGGWPCTEDPDSWAGRETDAAHIRGHEGSYRPLHCVDPTTGHPTLNDGFRYIPRRARAVAPSE